MPYEIIHKPTFVNQLLAMPPAELPRIIKKIEMLRDDPTPDAKVKKKLKGTQTSVYRLRAGDYRILYTYGPDWISLMAVDNRKDIYEGQLPEAEPVAVGVNSAPDLSDLIDGQRGHDATKQMAASAEEPLPQPLSPDLLSRLRIPEDYWVVLTAWRTLEALTTAPVPDEIRNRVFDAVMPANIDLVAAQPDYLTGDVDSLLRYVEGDLLGFLLKLDPHQQRLVDWGVQSSGPILLKGGPGTGKSVIALYRAQAMIRSLRRSGTEAPRILFTTYTAALINASDQLLQALLGSDAALVTVRTADSLAVDIVTSADGKPVIGSAEQVAGALQAAIREARFQGNELTLAAQRKAVERLSPQYLEAEFASVIEARELDDLEAYLAAPRQGRLVSLNHMQREAVWRVYERFRDAIQERGLRTWDQVRRRSAAIVRQPGWTSKYDGVIIDETQDLSPTSIRMLVGLAPSAGRIFVTADANQSIYGSSFRWSDVHEDLRFTGHTRSLRINYRSTREIGLAAYAYLAGSGLEEAAEQEYVKDGPLPAVRAVADAFAESELLSRFLPAAAREFRLGLGSCAVLVPTREAATALAGQLKYNGVDAQFMSGRDIDLSSPVVKLLTLKSAKGLEFPVVAIAGFVHSPNPGRRQAWSPKEREEWFETERRTVFVGMTRAMRALLVLVPNSGEAQVFGTFDGALWNLGDAR